jgi:hypothetical protein
VAGREELSAIDHDPAPRQRANELADVDSDDGILARGVN